MGGDKIDQNINLTNKLPLNYDSENRYKYNINKKESKKGNFVYYKSLLIGEGKYSKAYIGLNKDSFTLCAVKFEKAKNSGGHIEVESKILNLMKKFDGFPRIIDVGKNKGYDYIIESLIGPNLDNIMKYTNSPFDIVIVSQIGIQLLDVIEKLNNSGYLHCDLKPSNIGYGMLDINGLINYNKIYLLDFGNNRNFYVDQFKKDCQGNLCSIGKLHYEEEKDNKIFGTYSFMSQEVLEGNKPSRKSELESLMLVLIYLYKGSLPWSNLLSPSDSHKLKKMKDERKKTLKNELLKDLPSQFKFIYNSIKMLNFYSFPNYKLFRNNFLEIIKNNNGTIDQEFCFKDTIVKAFENNDFKNNNKGYFDKVKKLYSGLSK